VFGRHGGWVDGRGGIFWGGLSTRTRYPMGHGLRTTCDNDDLGVRKRLAVEVAESPHVKDVTSGDAPPPFWGGTQNMGRNAEHRRADESAPRSIPCQSVGKRAEGGQASVSGLRFARNQRCFTKNWTRPGLVP
jgi:hypothetical protein